MTEAILPEDPTSSDPRHIMTYNGFSTTGDVTGPLVYVNYGREEDYQELDVRPNLVGAAARLNVPDRVCQTAGVWT